MNQLVIGVLSCVFLMAIISLPATVHAQNCTAQFVVSNFTSFEAPNIICPVGYLPDSISQTCMPHDSLINLYNGKSCLSTACPQPFVCSEVAKVCVLPFTRRGGESCLAREQCVQADANKLNCVNGTCISIIHVKDRVLGQKCDVFDTAANKQYECAFPYWCINSACTQFVTTDVVGGSCNVLVNFTIATCGNGLVCGQSKCIPTVYNATKGQACEYSNSVNFVKCNPSLSCLNGACYEVKSVSLGETCTLDTNSFTSSICNITETLDCSPISSKCERYYNSVVGGFCGVKNESIYRCNGRCINEVCYSLKADVQLGGSCETIVGNQYYQCSGLFVCRSLTNGSQTTCQNKALKDEFCYTSSDCDTKLQCINSKCSNLNGKQVGTPCVYHMECDSGLCWNQVCSLNYNVTSCQNDNECLSYDSKCSCGGSASSSFIKPGTCVSLKRCKVFKSVLETCIGSNGRGLFPSLVFYDRNSTIHNACMKQFSQYFSCLRIGLTDANSRPSIPITGLDILAPVPENPAPFKIYQCLLFNSINFNVCGGAGDCVAENVCKCNKGYYEPFCWSIPPPTNSSTIKPIQSKIGNRNETISGSVSLRNVSMMAWMAIIVLIMSISL